MQQIVLLFVLVSTAYGTFLPLPEPRLGSVEPSMFADDELDLPYYLAHFPRLASAVVEEGPNRGFIAISVWRNAKDNRPYNARIMENTLSLAFFYATKRPWNLYYGSAGVRDRLEAALDFWVRIQAPTGAFSEYKPQGWNLAATAFATKFMGRTLRLLENGPPIEPELMKRVKAAQRKAILFVLTDSQFFEHGRTYSNQFTNVWPGALAWLSQQDDTEIRNLLHERVAQSKTEFQSPAGYFYEAGGPDWSYNLGTHHSNLLGAFSLAKSEALRQQFIEEERRFTEWLAFNVVPFDGQWMLNRAIETRQQLPAVRWSYRFALSEHVPLARAFVPTREQIQQERTEARRKLEREWPRVEPLPVGEFTAYAPYAFLHREDPQWLPTEAEKRTAVSQIPVNARSRFVHQRMDSRHPIVFTFIRQPRYYAVFNSGKQITRQQRLGLGLVWSDNFLLQSASRSSEGAWGTRLQAAELVYEAGDLQATFSTGDPQPGSRDLDANTVRVSYRLGSVGKKQITFGDRSIDVIVEHPGAFVEQIPASDRSRIVVGGREVESLPIQAKDRLEYSIRF
jgi:hypothetical protein